MITLRDQFSVTRLKIGLTLSLVKVYLGKKNRLPAKKGTSLNGVQATSSILSRVGETQLTTLRANPEVYLVQDRLDLGLINDSVVPPRSVG